MRLIFPWNSTLFPFCLFVDILQRRGVWRWGGAGGHGLCVPQSFSHAQVSPFLCSLLEFLEARGPWPLGPTRSHALASTVPFIPRIDDQFEIAQRRTFSGGIQFENRKKCPPLNYRWTFHKGQMCNSQRGVPSEAPFIGARSLQQALGVWRHTCSLTLSRYTRDPDLVVLCACFVVVVCERKRDWVRDVTHLAPFVHR